MKEIEKFRQQSLVAATAAAAAYKTPPCCMEVDLLALPGSVPSKDAAGDHAGGEPIKSHWILHLEHHVPGKWTTETDCTLALLQDLYINVSVH